MILKRTYVTGLCAGAAFLMFWVCSALAVTTTVWEQNTQKEFSSGKAKNISISSKNEIALSKALESVDEDMSELRVWSLAQDSQGNMYVGTGDKGKIFKIAKSGEVSLLFDSPETDIFSLIVDSADNLYAGTSPDGIVYRIKQDSAPETFFNTDEKYVWAMAFDKAGNLYAGTGMNGKIYKITPDGKGKDIYNSKDSHIKSLLSSGDYIYAGTEGGGIVYKISSDDKVSVLYDTSDREISCMAADAQGNLYVGAASGETIPGQQESGKPSLGGPERDREERRSSIYQITPDEVVTKIWRSPDPLVFSIIADGENLIVGTGEEGKVYSVTPKGDWTTVADCEESQVLSLYKVADTGEIWLTTGSEGKIYKLSANYVKEGTLEAKQQDASVTSKWGKISWDASVPEGSTVTFSTRSGNAEKPDDTWSEWSEDYTDSAGQMVTSPTARFIQWRAKLTSGTSTATPVIRGVSLAYLQKNLKPMVGAISIGAEQKGGEGPAVRPPDRGNNGEQGQGETDKTPLSGGKVIKWKAVDPNGDSLEYSVYFRGVEEQNWKLLEEEIKVPAHPLDTESFPDGTYLIKIVATDSPSNPMDIALSGEETSDPFDIDNTPPQVMDLKAVHAADGRYVVTGKIQDAASYIKEAVYSADGGDWKLIFPSDQIFDSKTENFSFPTEALGKGEHTIVVKATDAAGNVGSAKTVIPGE